MACSLLLVAILGQASAFPPVPQEDVYVADPNRDDMAYRSEVEQALGQIESDGTRDSGRLALHDLLSTHPRSPILRYEWGCQQAEQSRWEKAAREWALAADADGGRSMVSVRSLEGIAAVEAHLGHADAAIDALDRLSRVMPLSYAVWNRLAKALEDAGRKDRTREAWQASLDLNPSQGDVAARVGRKEADPGAPTELPALIRKVRASIVLVKTDEGHLTGFLALRRGWVVTAAHGFPQGDEKVQVTRFVEGRDPVKLDAVLAFRDRQRDVALVYCKDLPDDLPRLGLRSAKGLEVGERVYTVGNPGMGEEVLSLTPSEGIFSGERKKAEEPTYLQCNMAVNGGNSGGPLFDRWGRVLGIVVAKTPLEGVTFAVPAGQLAQALAAPGSLHAPPLPK